MKRIGGFLLIFLIVLLGFYFQPIFFPGETKKKPEPRQVTPPTHTSLKYESIAVSGYAKYIDQPITTFDQVYGSPILTQSSGFFYENRIYQLEKDTSRLEVSTKDGIVSSIKIFNGENQMIEPFQFGMTSNRLTNITTLYPDFSFEYDQEPVAIELTEEDMDYRPLIAFDNGSFAMLFFDREDKRLSAVQYFDKEMLLRLIPYKIDSGNPLAFRKEENVDWNQLNTQKEAEIYGLITLVREEKNLPPYKMQMSSQTDAKRLLRQFLTRPDRFLTEERSDEWASEQNAQLSNQSFSLTKKEFKNTADRLNINYRRGLLYSPVVDPAFSMFYWLTEDSVAETFASEKARGMGVAFNQENVVVLTQELDDRTKESETN